MTITITTRNGSITVKVREDQAKKAPRREEPKLVKGFVLKGWDPEE